MEGNESNQEMQPQSATLCKAGCGFYGSSSSDGYCSVCFKEKLQRCLLLSNVSTTTSNSSQMPSSIASNNSNNDDDDDDDDGKTQVHPRSEEVGDSARTNTEPAITPPSDDTPAVASNTNVEDRVNQPPAEVEDSKPVSPPASSSDPSEILQKVKDGDEEEEKVKVVDGDNLNKRNRCYVCKKKVGLTGFGCRCGGLFCGLHRYSDTHGCTFDYKEQGQQEIRKNNPRIAFQKVAKI